MLVNFNSYETEIFDIDINKKWIEYIETGKIKSSSKNIDINTYKLKSGKYSGKTLDKVPYSYLDYLCNSTVYDEPSSLSSFGGKRGGEKKVLNILDTHTFKKNNNMEVNKSILTLVDKHNEVCCIARMYADKHNLCIGCFKNKTDMLVCAGCYR